MNKKIIKIILITFTVVLAILEGLYLLLLPAMLNADIRSGKFSKFVYETTGLTVEYDSMKIRTSPLFSFALSADNLSILSKEKEQAFSSKSFKSSVHLPSLVFGRLKLNYLKANDLKMILVVNNERKLLFAGIPLDIKFDKEMKPNLDLNGINVTDSKLLLADKVLNKNIEMNIENLQFSFKKNHSGGLTLKSQIFADKKKKTDADIEYFSKLPIEKGLNNNKFILHGYIKNLDLSDYSSYFSLFSDDIKNVKGVINAEFENDKILTAKATLKNFVVDMKNPLDTIFSNEEINFNSKTRFSANRMVFDDANIYTKDWNISVNGSVKNYSSSNLKNIKPDLNVLVKNSDIHSLYWLVPSVKEDPMQVMQKFKKYGAWGCADGELQIKGTAQLPLIYGKLNLDDVYIVKNNPVVEHCKIYTEFLGDKLSLKTRVWAGYGEYVDIEGVGEMTFYSKGEFWVKSSDNVDLNTAEYMLVPIHEIVGFELGPVPFMDIKGKGNIDIHTKGTVLDGEVDGQFNFKNVEARLDGLNTLLTNADGALTFNKKDMHFYTTSALIDKKPVKIDGKANLSGDIDFDVTADNMEIGYLLNILNTSEIVESRKHLAEPIEKISGNTNIKLKILGVVKDFATIRENETLVIKGELGLKDVAAKLKFCPLVLRTIQGLVSFDNDGWNMDVFGMEGTSKFVLKGYSRSDKADISINGSALKVDDVIKLASTSEIKELSGLSKIGKTNSLLDFTSEYKSNKGLSAENFSLNNLVAKGRFYPATKNATTGSLNNFSGDFSLSKGVFVLKKFSSKIYNSSMFADIKIADFFGKKPIVNGKVNITEFDLTHLNSVKSLSILPNSVKKLIDAYENYQGHVDTSLKIRNNNLDGYVNLSNIKFNHAYFKTPVVVDSGKILLDASRVTIKSMIANIDELPVFMNFSVWDFDKTMRFDGYFTTKLTDKFANKYINPMLTYPIKPKGDITVAADFDGTLESVNVHPKLRIAPDADIYYMGANLGDVTDERELYADLNVTNNRYTLKKLDYVRYMTSQNDRSYPLTVFNANGVFDKVDEKGKKTFFIKNFNIQTLNNANVKIFNVLFKKSVLKNGMFNCKLNVKGNINAPVIRGNVTMHNIDMPLFETMVKNITLKFNDKTIDIVADGSVMKSDFNLVALMKNTATAPYVFDNIDIRSKKLSLNNFIDALTKVPTPDGSKKFVQTQPQYSLPVNVADVQIQKGSLSVDNIKIRDLEANNFKSEFSLGKNMLLDIKNLVFDVEGGKMTGSASYNFANAKVKANVSAENVDSNKVASNLFGVKDQIFGQANGNIVVSSKGSTEEERLRNLSGNVYFEIVDGKMPKLGSVEYLLKAGNLIKSGITGASLNNFIDLLAPIKTGYFDSIKGNFDLKNGVAQDVEVYSKGDNLNLFINGEYDILSQYADLRVFGRLTRKAVNILGPVGNMSFNSLLNAIPGIKFDKTGKNSIIKEINKIPGVELSDKEYRVFSVKLDGHFNDDKFVKNFRWVE